MLLRLCPAHIAAVCIIAVFTFSAMIWSDSHVAGSFVTALSTGSVAIAARAAQGHIFSSANSGVTANATDCSTLKARGDESGAASCAPGANAVAKSAASVAGSVAVITPTYERSTRFADLVHVASTLQVAQSWGIDILWVLVEDASEVDPTVRQMLQETGLPHQYFPQEPAKRRYREVHQRNDALRIIRDSSFNGTIYMTDDDNAIRPELLREIAQLPPMTFTLFAVGNIGTDGVEAPIFDLVQPGKMAITQWICSWCPRRWNIDMAGYAFHSDLLHVEKNPPKFSGRTRRGFLENDFLKAIEVAGGELVVVPTLLNTVRAWHDHSEMQRNTDYKTDWTISELREQRLLKGEMQLRDCRGHYDQKECRFAWAVKDLPLARVLA